MRNKLHRTIRHLPLATQLPTSKPRRAFVDPALALDKIPQRLIQVLEFRRVPQHPRPFAPRPLFSSSTVNSISSWRSQARKRRRQSARRSRGENLGSSSMVLPNCLRHQSPRRNIVPRHDSFYPCHDVFYRLCVCRRNDLETAVAFRAAPNMTNSRVIAILRPWGQSAPVALDALYPEA